MPKRLEQAKKLATQIKQSLISEKVLLDTTRAIGTLLHPLRAPKSSLEEYLKTFTLGISVSEVHKLIDLLPYANILVGSYISYELGNHSPELKGCYKYLRSEGTVTIHTPPTQIRVSVHPPTRPEELAQLRAKVENCKASLIRTMSAKEILNTTTKAIGKLFYQKDKPKSSLERFLKNFDLELSVTAVVACLDNHQPDWETRQEKCYYLLGRFSQVTGQRFEYNSFTKALSIDSLLIKTDESLRGNSVGSPNLKHETDLEELPTEFPPPPPKKPEDGLVRLANVIIAGTTKRVGEIIWSLTEREICLFEYLATFDLKVDADEVLLTVDLADLEYAGSIDCVCYDLCNLSPTVKDYVTYVKDQNVLLIKMFVDTPLTRTACLELSCPVTEAEITDGVCLMHRENLKLNISSKPTIRFTVANEILEATTKSIAKKFWVEDRHPSTLDSYLTKFRLDLTVEHVFTHMDIHYPGWETGKERVYYTLGCISRVTRTRFLYNKENHTVEIKPLEEKQRKMLRGDLPLDKVQIVEEIINTTTDSIGVMFYQVDKPKCLMEHFLRDFDLQLSVTNVIEFLDKQHPGWEKDNLRCYYDLASISPTASDRFIYNPENGSSAITSFPNVDDPKRESSPDWLCANMQPKPEQEIKLQFTVPEGMENQAYYMRPVAKQAATDLRNQLNDSDYYLKNQFKAVATLFWIVAPPVGVSLDQYIFDFQWPTKKVKMDIGKTPLSYRDTLVAYELINNPDVKEKMPEIASLLVRIEQIRYNPHLTGKFVFSVKHDKFRVTSKFIPM